MPFCTEELMTSVQQDRIHSNDLVANMYFGQSNKVFLSGVPGWSCKTNGSTYRIAALNCFNPPSVISLTNGSRHFKLLQLVRVGPHVHSTVYQNTVYDCRTEWFPIDTCIASTDSRGISIPTFSSSESIYFLFFFYCNPVPWLLALFGALKKNRKPLKPMWSV